MVVMVGRAPLTIAVDLTKPSVNKTGLALSIKPCELVTVVIGLDMVTLVLVGLKVCCTEVVNLL